MTRERFGPPRVLELQDVEKPAVGDDEVLVRVRASSVNRADWYELTGTPLIGRPMMGVRKPKTPLVGADFAGTVEVVGTSVTDFQPGDEVYGARSGAFSEYVSTAKVARKPANLTFDEAAAVPVAGLTALQGLRDHGQLRAGQQVLVNGASGGVGTFAVQIAKALGGEVTAVCSTRNVEQARALGADHVIDYTREDFTRSGRRYDVVLDIAGTKSWRRLKRVLAPEARVVITGGPKGRLLGPLGHMAGMKIWSIHSDRAAVFFIADVKRADLDTLRELIEAGKVKPAIEQAFPLAELPEALRLMGEGHAQGKLVISL